MDVESDGAVEEVDADAEEEEDDDTESDEDEIDEVKAGQMFVADDMAAQVPEKGSEDIQLLKRYKYLRNKRVLAFYRHCTPARKLFLRAYRHLFAPFIQDEQLLKQRGRSFKRRNRFKRKRTVIHVSGSADTTSTNHPDDSGAVALATAVTGTAASATTATDSTSSATTTAAATTSTTVDENVTPEIPPPRKRKYLSAQPSYVTGEMRPYQIKGVNFLIHHFDHGIGCILADEMGLGKTLQTLAFLAYLKNERKLAGPHLIVVPLSTAHNWMREMQKWTPSLTFIKLQGHISERDDLFLRPDVIHLAFDVVVTTFETCISEIDYFRSIRWLTVILDEAHKIKNAKSRLHQCISEFKSCNQVLLTGTPLQNDLYELMALFTYLMPEVNFDAQVFSNAFNVTAKEGTTRNEILLSSAASLLKVLMLRRTKREVTPDLPPRTEINIFVPLTRMQNEMYRRLLLKDTQTLEHQFSMQVIMNIVMSLRVLCNHPVQTLKKRLQDIPEQVQQLRAAQRRKKWLDRVPHLRHRRTRRPVLNSSMDSSGQIEAGDDEQNSSDAFGFDIDAFSEKYYSQEFKAFGRRSLSHSPQLNDFFTYIINAKKPGQSLLSHLPAANMPRKLACYPIFRGLFESVVDGLNQERQRIVETILAKPIALSSVLSGVSSVIPPAIKTERPPGELQAASSTHQPGTSSSVHTDTGRSYTSTDVNCEQRLTETQNGATELNSELHVGHARSKTFTKTAVSAIARYPGADDTFIYNNDAADTTVLSPPAAYSVSTSLTTVTPTAATDTSSTFSSTTSADSTTTASATHTTASISTKAITSPTTDFVPSSSKSISANVATRTSSTSTHAGATSTAAAATTGTATTTTIINQAKSVDDTEPCKIESIHKNGASSTTILTDSIQSNGVFVPTTAPQTSQTIDDKLNDIWSKADISRLVACSGKMTVLDKLLQRIAAAPGSRVLLFSQFTHTLDILELYVISQGWFYKRLDGQTNHIIRELDVREFNEPDNACFIYLISTRAGGQGINLASADNVILYDSDWNPQVDAQAMARAHRIGQTKPVAVYRIISEGTIEESVFQRAAQRLYLDAMVVGRKKKKRNDDYQLEEGKLSAKAVWSMLKKGARGVFKSTGDDVSKVDLDQLLDRSLKHMEQMKMNVEKKRKRRQEKSQQAQEGNILVGSAVVRGRAFATFDICVCTIGRSSKSHERASGSFF